MASYVAGNTATGGQGPGVSLTRVGTAVTNETVTPAAITGLAATLPAATAFKGELVLIASNTTAADGLRVDFDGGTATMTSFYAYVVENVVAATFSVALSAALATDLIATTMADTGVALILIRFGGVSNAAGTIVPRFALEADSGGIITAGVSSWMQVEQF